MIAPLLIAGIVYICLTHFETGGYLLLSSLISLFVGIGFKLFTIPFEKNASKIGIDFLKENELITPSEERNIKKILKAASNTYVADFYRTVGNSMKK